MNQPINITLKEYTEMTVKVNYLEMMLDAIYETARLDYSGTDLWFDDGTIQNVLKILDSETYHACLEAKVKEKKLKEATENDTL